MNQRKTYHKNVYETIRGLLKKFEQCQKNNYINEVHKHKKMLNRLKKFADRSK